MRQHWFELIVLISPITRDGGEEREQLISRDCSCPLSVSSFPSLHSVRRRCQLCALGRAAESVTKEQTQSQHGASVLPSEIEATHTHTHTLTPEAMPGATR